MRMADVPSRRREVLCPRCSTLLLEPPETEIYECPICLTCLQAKGTRSNSQKEALQGPSIEINGSTTCQQEASSVNDCETQGQDRLNNDETKEHVPMDKSTRQQEQGETVLVGKEEDSQLQCHSETSVANLSIRNFASRDLSGRNVASASKGGLADETEVSRDHLMQQGSLVEKAVTHLSFQGETSGNGFVSECISVENTKIKHDKEMVTSGIDCSKPLTRTGKNALAGECAGVEETYQEEGNRLNDKNEQKFESEIIRDNDCELSFKYIASSLKPNVQLAEKKKTHTLVKLSSEASGGEDEVATIPGLLLELPPLNNENSDDYESYPSFSESPSRDASDSEFDFPAPSAESMHSAKLSETFLQPKSPEGPHQLEWRDADYYHTISAFQESNSSTVSSVGIIVSNIASNVVAQVELGDKEEIAEDGPRIKKDLSTKIVVSRGLGDTTATVSIGFSGIEGLAKTEEKLASERCNKVPISGTISGNPDFDDKEGSLVDTVNDCEMKLHSESKENLLESSRLGVEQISQLKPFSILRGHVQPSVADPSTSTLLGVSQMKTCLTVEEDAELILSVANLALKDSSTSSLHDTVVDTLEGNKRRERPVAGPIVATGGDAEDLRKELDSGGLQLPCVIEQINVSRNGTISEGHYPGEEVQMHNRVDVVKTSDPKLHRKRNYSSDAAQLLNSKEVATSSATHQDQGNIQNEDLYISAAMTPEWSLRALEGHAQAAPILAGQSLQLQNPQADLHPIGQTIHTVEAPSVFPASSQSFGSNIYFDGSRSFANTVCSYQTPSHPLMLPIAMPGHVCTHHGCHPVGPVCMPYVHGQHSLVPHLPTQSCLLCLRTMGHYQGHTELGNFPRGFQVQAACLVCHSPTCFPPQIAHMHDTSMTAAKPLMSSVRRKPKHYPPLPQGRTAPYVVCKGCNAIVEVPVYLSASGAGAQKLRCGGCGKVSKFSVLKHTKKSHLVGLESSAVGSSRKASTSSSPSFEFMVRNRELDMGQRIESSYGKSLHLQNQRGSISSRHYTGSGHHSSQGELTFKVKPSQDEPNAKLPIAINKHSSQDEFFFRSLSRKSEFDSSRSLFRGFKTMSARFGVNNVCNDGLIGSDDVPPSQCTVDEKEEGLDFGAPRPSDGESLDQRSPESRMRSPEKLELVDQPRHRSSFGDEEGCWATTEIEQDFGSERNNITQERSSKSLFALLNQESTKFEIYEESTSALSPASKSPVHDRPNQSSSLRKKEIGRARNLRGPQFAKKGPRYIAAMLTRSLKHRVND